MPTIARFVCLALLLSLAGCARPTGPAQLTVSTGPITLDSLVVGGGGPATTAEFLLLKEYPETVFLTGASVRVVPQAGSRLTPEKAARLLWGASLRWRAPARHAELLSLKHPVEPNLFCFGPGVREVELPAGFGIPLLSNESLILVGEWMNDDCYLPPTEVRLEATVHFARGQSLRPLKAVAVFGLALTEGKQPYFGVAKPDPKQLGPGCLRGEALPGVPPIRDPLGQVFQSKWLLLGGERLSNRTLIDSQLQLPGRLCAVAPYATANLRSLEIRDLSQSSPLYQYSPDKPVQGFPAGLPLSVEHHYELECVHENADAVNAMALAMAQLYLEESDYRP